MCGVCGNWGERSRCCAAFLDKGISIKFVTLGTYHSAALTNENILYTWGSNKYGCLGAEIEDEFTPAPQRVAPPPLPPRGHSDAV